MLIALDAIDLPPNPVRHTVDKAADTRLQDSIRQLGVLTPVLAVRQGDRFQIVAGSRRVQAARAVGKTEIPAEIATDIDAGFLHAAATAENVVRAEMAPVDQWRAIVEMQRLGKTLPAAAAALGITERHAQQLTKLGQLHPAVIKLIEQYGMPPSHFLRDIAMADRKAQAAAAQVKGIITTNWNGKGVEWHRIATACRADRISRARALFDVETAGVLFEEDLFAEPNSDEQFTTRDITGFQKAQAAAILEAAAKKKHRVEIVDHTPAGPAIPKGFKVIELYTTRAPKKHETAFSAINARGEVYTTIAVDAAEEKAREAKRKAAEREADKTANAGAKSTGLPATIQTEPTTAEDDSDATAAAPDRMPITKAGQQLLAQERTKALRDALRDTDSPIEPDVLAVCLVLLLFARNVSINGMEPGAGEHRGQDLIRRLVLPSGKVTSDTNELWAVVSEALARCLAVNGPDAERSQYSPGSGIAAEWIGHAVIADDYLPRLDTPEFLATVNAETLKAAAIEVLGKAPKGSAKNLREALAGKAEKWRPSFATFGAAGPKPGAERVVADSDEGEDGEEPSEIGDAA